MCQRRKSTWAVLAIMTVFAFGVSFYSITVANFLFHLFGDLSLFDSAFYDVGEYFQVALGAMLFLIIKQACKDAVCRRRKSLEG